MPQPITTPNGYRAPVGAPRGAYKGVTQMGTSTTTKRGGYAPEVYAIATKARAMACPITKQGPCPKQVADTMRVLGEDPFAVLAGVPISVAQLTRIANGEDRIGARKLAQLGDSICAAGGARQWTRGRYLASTLVYWCRWYRAQQAKQVGDTQTA